MSVNLTVILADLLICASTTIKVGDYTLASNISLDVLLKDSIVDERGDVIVFFTESEPNTLPKVTNIGIHSPKRGLSTAFDLPSFDNVLTIEPVDMPQIKRKQLKGTAKAFSKMLIKALSTGGVALSSERGFEITEVRPEHILSDLTSAKTCNLVVTDLNQVFISADGVWYDYANLKVTGYTFHRL